MNRFLLLLLISICAIPLWAQQFRYSHAFYEEVDTLKNIEYAQAEWLNNPISLLAEYNIHDGENTTTLKPLYMDIFMPKDEYFKNRPAIVFAHSGGFLIGSRLSEDMLAMCDSFARKGYVTATIDYRIGMGAEVSRFLGIPIGVKVNEPNGYRAFYRAIQDSRAAIRFLKRNSGTYGIDTTKVFFVGSSAGAILSIQNLYLDKPEEVFADVFASPSLGNLDAIGFHGFGGKANASVAMWGALQSPEIIENEKTPIFLIHGTDDNVVPFKKGMPLDGIVPANPAASLTMPQSFGSFCIDTALNNRGIEHETYFVEGKKHEFYGAGTGNFPPEGPNVYWDTIQWKIRDFLLSQFQPKADFEFEAQNLVVNFTNTSSDKYDAFWDFGDGTTGNDVYKHTYQQPGTYNVKLVVCNRNLACGTVTKQVVVDTNVLAENNRLNAIKIYPNPATDIIYFEGIAEPYDIKIYNLDGKILKTQEHLDDNQIDINELQTGFYIIEIKISERKIFRKFLKAD
jgi:acetyl esterase/lipase